MTLWEKMKKKSGEHWAGGGNCYAPSAPHVSLWEKPCTVCHFGLAAAGVCSGRTFFRYCIDLLDNKMTLILFCMRRTLPFVRRERNLLLRQRGGTVRTLVLFPPRVTPAPRSMEESGQANQPVGGFPRDGMPGQLSADRPGSVRGRLGSRTSSGNYARGPPTLARLLTPPYACCPAWFGQRLSTSAFGPTASAETYCTG
jgi:hypothetical protein